MSTFGRIAASSPVNKQAAMAVSARGEAPHNAKIGGHVVNTDAPPSMRAVPDGMEDLTGISFGRFRIVGLYSQKNSKGKTLWVCKCACSLYETRTNAAIKNADSVDDRCHHCRKLKYIQEEATEKSRLKRKALGI